MIRFLIFLCAAPLLWCQAEGRYHYASLAVKTGVAFEALVRSGDVSLAKQSAARFSIDHPAAPGRALSLAATPSGSVLAGGPSAGGPELFVALRASAQPVALGAGEWSAVMISLDGGKARGLRTAFLDFTVATGGAMSKATLVSHESAVDDVCHSETAEMKAGPASLEIMGLKYALAVAAAGDLFLATSSAPAAPSLVIAARRNRDASMMSMRGSYALAEIGARNTFAFAPDQARFFSTLGAIDANGGHARLTQRVTLADSATQFRGAAAYMVNYGGGGTFSPRLEQRRRNLAVASDESVFITAQVAETGQLSLLHGIGIGLRVMELNPPVLAPRATAQGDVVSLYGRNLEGVQVLIAGQPAAIAQAWPNQINIKLAAPPTSPLNVELDWQGGRTPPASVVIAATPPDFAAAPAEPGGFIAPAQPGAPGDTIELGITGASPPTSFTVLFDGVPGHVVSSALAAGTTRLKVTLPKNLTPSMQVNVALAALGHYVDLGDIAVARAPHKPATTTASH